MATGWRAWDGTFVAIRGLRPPRRSSGSGDVTLKMAALVGAEGNVVGVDRDQSILQLASQEAERQGLQVTDEYHQEGGSAYRRSPLLTQMAQGMTSSSIHPTSGSARAAKS